METIHVLGWIDGRDDFVRIDLLWQRQLHQDAVDLLVSIERRDQIDQLDFTGDGGQLVVESLHAGFRHRLGFIADVDFACRVFADQNNGEARHDTAIATQAMDGIRHLATQVRRDCLAVDNTCGHDPPVASSKQGLARRNDFLQRLGGESGQTPLRAGYTTLEHVWIDVPDDNVFQEQDEQDQDHRRNIDAAKIGQQLNVSAATAAR